MVFSPKDLTHWVVILILVRNMGLLGACYSVSMLHACLAQNCIHATTCYCATVTKILNKDNLIQERCILSLDYVSKEGQDHDGEIYRGS